jgi:hypothetical protein
VRVEAASSERRGVRRKGDGDEWCGDGASTRAEGQRRATPSDDLASTILVELSDHDNDGTNRGLMSVYVSL